MILYHTGLYRAELGRTGAAPPAPSIALMSPPWPLLSHPHLQPAPTATADTHGAGRGGLSLEASKALV